ncbi:MAG: hypothetical protein HQ518_08150 [Rhodopirellula sp.]|nr:hypothetical protein [Rhodopirellula sp.]
MSSGLWIKMRRSLSSDPDVFRIGELTELNRFAVVGKLHAVWSWADEHDVTSRDAVSVTHSYIDQVADHEGFAKAMCQVGWLAGADGALMFPNFGRHNGRDAKRKAQTAERNQRMRSRCEVSPLADDDEKRDAPSVTEASPEKSREEKSRQRKKKPAVAALPPEVMSQFVDAWNATGLVQCRSLTEKRRAALRVRLTDDDWKTSWREALDRAAQSSFCRGGNDRGWRGDVDWFLKPDTVTQLCEGKFDDSKGGKGKSTQDVPQQRLTAEQKKYLEGRAHVAKS